MAESRSPRQRAGLKRPTLISFGALFIVLFTVIALREGVGAPDIPDGYVAVIEDVPQEIGRVSEADLNHALVQQLAVAGLDKAPSRDTPEFADLRDKAMEDLLNSIWIQGQAEEMGIKVNHRKIARELALINRKGPKTRASFEKFFKESRFNKEDVRTHIKLALLSREIQERLARETQTPTPPKSEIEAYYEAAKAGQFTSSASRDVRIIVNKSKYRAEEALAALEHDSSNKSWEMLAKKYSEDEATKSRGGLTLGLSEEAMPEPLGASIFQASTRHIEGVLKGAGGFYVFEVERENPEKVQALKEVESLISSQLSQRDQEELFSEFASEYQALWTSRTFCADGYAMEQCANYPGGGHPPTAPPACYEEKPDAPSEACPAPVTPTQPALPGSTSILAPKGKQLPQRPQPEGLEEIDDGEGIGVE